MGSRTRYLVITTCTNRKRHTAPPELQARSLQKNALCKVAEEWTGRIADAVPVCPASDLYVGRGFKEAALASANVNGDLWVLSAGLGLTSAETLVPSYDLTVSPGSVYDIRTRIKRKTWSPSDWWDALHCREDSQNRSMISDQIRDYPKQIFLISLSASYSRLIQNDLFHISDSDLSRIRIFGLGLERILPPRFHRSIMPYDNRLDGHGSPSKGTLSDFSQRAMRHFSELLSSGAACGTDIESDSRAVAKIVSSWEWPHVPKREPKSDEEIRKLIDDHWDTVKGRSGRMLRLLRDEIGVACEQSRFKRLFREQSGFKTAR